MQTNHARARNCCASSLVASARAQLTGVLLLLLLSFFLSVLRTTACRSITTG